MKKLEAIRKRVEVATKGPWEVSDPPVPLDGPGFQIRWGGVLLGALRFAEDRRFVVRAREDIELLLRVVQAMKTDIEIHGQMNHPNSVRAIAALDAEEE